MHNCKIWPFATIWGFIEVRKFYTFLISDSYPLFKDRILRAELIAAQEVYFNGKRALEMKNKSNVD